MIGNKDQFAPPIFIDAELVTLLTLKGQQTRSNRILIITLGIVFGFFVTSLSNLFGMPIIYLLLGLTAASVGISYFKTIVLLNAYRARRFDKVTQLLPSALEWSTQMNPFTYFQSIQCLQTQFSLLILEGRFSEFEALNRFSWAVTEKHETISASPKNWAIASNLAIAFFLQHNYDAAITLFYENLPKAKRKSDRLTIMCNLIYCLIKNNEIDEAERYLYEALELNGKNMESLFGMRLQFLSTYLQTEKGELDSAELSIQHASELSLRLKQPDDFRAYCNAAMAEIRRRQKRFDEAELYFRNAIDVLASADNPAYLDLGMMYRDYAQTLLEAGDPGESAKQMMRAHSCYDFYVKRETDTVNLMRERLQAKKPIRMVTQLLNLGNRVKSIEVLDIQ